MNQKTIVVTGSNGFIGSKIIEYLARNSNYLVFGWSKGINRIQDCDFSYTNINLTNSKLVDKNFSIVKPDILIHCAAISQVDVCEENPKLCYEINVDVTAQLVHLSNRFGTRIIHFSSDFVFDGKKEWVEENMTPDPLSKYGETKRNAERVVEKADNWAVIRPVLVYGYSQSASRGNIFTWVLESVKAQRPINVVGDQFRTPTFVGDVVKLVENLMDNMGNGYFHIGGADRLSVYEFVMKIAKEAGLSGSLITREESVGVNGANLRPQYSCFNNKKMKMLFRDNPIGVEEGIRKSLSQII